MHGKYPPKNTTAMKSFYQENWQRSIVKAIAYRIIIIILDFLTVFVLTKKTELALGFVVVSNIYTTLAYFIHERLWNKIHWGIEKNKR